MKKTMTFPRNFKPSKKFDLIRLGKDNDGGYLVGKYNFKNKILVSLGIEMTVHLKRIF